MKLYYRKMGAGPVMIILHGLYGMSDNWLSIGKELSEHFTVYLPDLRNHGRSPHDPEHNYEVMSYDLKEFMDEHKIDRAVLVGHSMGGKVIMHFSEIYQEKISGLIVIDMSPRSYKKLNEQSPQTIDHMNIIRSMMDVDFSSVSDRQDVDRQLSETLPSRKVRQFLLKSMGVNKNKEFYWKINLEALQNGLPDIMDGLDIDHYRRGKGITVFPVLFIKGSESGYIEDEDYELIHTVYPRAEVTVIPKAGHWLHAEQPDLLIKQMKYFLGVTA